MLVHTDFGHDPDDCIALAYLIEHGTDIDQISVSPGNTQQITSLTGFLRSYGYINTGPDISTSKKMVYKDGFQTGKHRMFDGVNVKKTWSYEETPAFNHIQCNRALIIGPAKNLGGKLKSEVMVFQGGYSPNSIKPLPKFEGKHAVPSFNPNGAPKDFQELMNSKDIWEKYYVGKNVCHGFTKAHLQKFWEPENKKVREFWDKLSPTKAMHDVLAAMCMVTVTQQKVLNLTWENKKPMRINGMYTTEPNEPYDRIHTLIGADYDVGV